MKYARSSGHMKTTAVKDKLLENNQQINWVPPEIGKGRFGQWLENNIDWALSRERYWGTPLNIWQCDNCSEVIVPSSFKELKSYAIGEIPEPIDPHRPYVDDIEFKCPKCDSKMHRVKDVIDCWFDSGAMPYAQYHCPFQQKDNFGLHFPADFISEGVDQTRGWFYTLLAISTLVSGVPSYKNVLVVGLVLDKNGQKMSKSKGNVVPPQEIIEKYGADPLRYYLMAVSQPWLPINFNIPDVHLQSWNFFETLKNVVNFFCLYANIDNYEPKSKPLLAGSPPENLTILDRWLLSRPVSYTHLTLPTN